MALDINAVSSLFKGYADEEDKFQERKRKDKKQALEEKQFEELKKYKQVLADYYRKKIEESDRDYYRDIFNDRSQADLRKAQAENLYASAEKTRKGDPIRDEAERLAIEEKKKANRDMDMLRFVAGAIDAQTYDPNFRKNVPDVKGDPDVPAGTMTPERSLEETYSNRFYTPWGVREFTKAGNTDDAKGQRLLEMIVDSVTQGSNMKPEELKALATRKAFGFPKDTDKTPTPLSEKDKMKMANERNLALTEARSGGYIDSDGNRVPFRNLQDALTAIAEAYPMMDVTDPEFLQAIEQGLQPQQEGGGWLSMIGRGINSWLNKGKQPRVVGKDKDGMPLVEVDY